MVSVVPGSHYIADSDDEWGEHEVSCHTKLGPLSVLTYRFKLLSPPS